MKKQNDLKSFKRFSKRLMKGKPFRKSEFGTGLSDMTLRGALRMRSSRPYGHRESPPVLYLQARETAADPVRIYVGTEPAQHRAERVLLWSILKHRSSDRRYEIHLMKDLKGLDRSTWKTGFTAYRYAIPEFTGFSGRAIYNDVDQIYLADPARLLDLDMSGAAVLAVQRRDTSVMLLDCAPLAGIWTVDAIRQTPRGIHTEMLRRLRARGLISDLPRCWNSRDHEYDANTSCLLHYTILHTQPWRPFPRDLRYRDNPLSAIWEELELEADAAGFAPQWKEHPDRPYTDMSDFFDRISEG